MMRRNGRITKTITKAVAIALSFSIIFGSTIGSYANELETISGLLNEAGSEIGTAEETEVDFSEIVVDTTEQVEENLSSFDVSANIVDTKSDEVIDNANVANTTSDREVAYAAKETAETELANAEAALEDTNTSYDNAYNNFNSVSENYANADSAYNTAVAALEDVSANTLAAEKVLEEAKALIDIETSNKEKLENIEDQYYGLMVYYYNYLLKDNTVYVDGKLDISANAAQLTEKKINDFAKNGDNKFFTYGRYLTKELVEYMVVNRNDVSYNNEENEFTFGTTGTGSKQDASEVLTYTDENGKVLTATGETEKYIWNKTNYNGGRGNSVEVTYKDISGNLHTEHYNYVLKSSTYGDTLDVENGMFYLALVEKDSDNRYYPVTFTDENDLSDYSKVTAAVAAYQVLNDYIAKYNEAEEAVKTLKARYNELSVSANATKAELDSLKAALEDASEALALAETKKEEVTAKYEEAKKAVEGIDLSRFAVVPVNVVTEDAPAPAAEPTEEEPVVIILPDETPLVAVPVFAAPEGEEEDDAEEVTAVVAIDEDAAPLADGPAATEEPEEVIAAAPVVETITTDISGDNVPLAGLAFADSVKKVWWLWLLILLTVVTMYIIYKKNTKKEEN